MPESTRTRPPRSREEIAELHRLPLSELVFRAAMVHHEHHDPSAVQTVVLDSIQSGGCEEDCHYCPHSGRWGVVEAGGLSTASEVLQRAARARDEGATAFCLGAAWREVQDGEPFQETLRAVRGIRSLGLETSATLGLLRPEHALALAEAGLDYYNHNIDTSPEYYARIISTREFEDRLETIDAVRAAGLKLCSGGILGMGETPDDRIGLLLALAELEPQPESVPVNLLVPAKGTPLGQAEPATWDVVVRFVAVARILMPAARLRLGTGRRRLAEAAQALCLMAGAGSLYLRDDLLWEVDDDPASDLAMLRRLGRSAELPI